LRQRLIGSDNSGGREEIRRENIERNSIYIGVTHLARLINVRM